MNNLNVNLSLSSHCFVPFIAYRLTEAKVVWVNMPLLHQYDLFLEKQVPDHNITNWLLDEFAYTTFKDSQGIDRDNQSLFYAERYGGQAINRNGGGARTGLKGQFQVKGIGPNALVGEGSDFWYSHGSATLVDMIQEALWGEVCHHLLPYGSTRCLAVIQTGIDAIGDEQQKKISLPGGLVVRENALRIAHFERAPFFSPSKTRFDLISDTDRTKAALESFKYCLEQVVDSQVGELSDGLKLLINRWAIQFAYAKAVRLMHGAITSSNLCLDGRWIDFGTISTLGQHTNTITGRGNPPFWHDHTPLYDSIYNLCFYINKLGTKDDRGVDSDELIQHFNQCYELALRKYFIALIGIPLSYVEIVVDCEEAKNFHFHLMRMLQMGGLEEHTSIPKHEERRGFYSYARIINLLDGIKLDESKLEDTLLVLYRALVDKIELIAGVDITAERRTLLEGREDDLNPLHFDLLKGDIFKIVDEPDLNKKVSVLINRRIGLAYKMRLQ
ncbi:hypothetical protein [Photobacterium sanguinicancri]|uniref:hypothetical protein n=1 Tax=Photobacterium sanguinicancri TaxID=875932 RepID=UPI0026E1EFD2|nr:hypothetical protein [Photobacterium sanguinicancri]MDO6498217.1 hypothetical protein [Photobacterium sanguinicancri]